MQRRGLRVPRVQGSSLRRNPSVLSLKLRSQICTACFTKKYIIRRNRADIPWLRHKLTRHHYCTCLVWHFSRALKLWSQVVSNEIHYCEVVLMCLPIIFRSYGDEARYCSPFGSPGLWYFSVFILSNACWLTRCLLSVITLNSAACPEWALFTTLFSYAGTITSRMNVYGISHGHSL